MTETINNEQIIELSIETTNDEQIEELQLEIKQLTSNNEQINETLDFINECGMSIFNFTKDNTNNVILKTKKKIITKKYALFQYNIYNENYFYVARFATFTDISKFLETLKIKINLKSLIKNKLFKIELN